MKLGIISDTHDHVGNVQKALDVFSRENVSCVLHLGDWVAPSAVLSKFEGVKFRGVFGNNDGERMKMTHLARDWGVDLKSEFVAFEEDGLKFALYHGHIGEITEALVSSQLYDVVFTGHTHKKLERTVGKTIHINPGTAHGFGGEATVAIFDTEDKSCRFVTL